jgi:polysaccharide biosynthesis transport protein
MSKENRGDLRWTLSIIWRRFWLIVGCMLVAALIAWWYTSTIPTDYEATATLLVESAQGAQANEYATLVAGERLTLTYGQMLKGQHILETVIAELGLRETPKELAKRVSVEPIRDTRLIRLSVTDSSAEQAALLANTIANAFIVHIRVLQEERYSGPLDTMQGKLETLTAEMAKTKDQVNALTAQRIEQETDSARLQILLDKYREDYRVLQADYQSLESDIGRLSHNVKLVEVTQPSFSEDPTRSMAARWMAAVTHAEWQPLLPLCRFCYTATVTLLVDQAAIAGGTDYSAILASERLAATYGQILTGWPVLEAAIAQLGLNETTDAVANQITVEPVPGTALIRLVVRDNSLAQATDLATAIARAFVSQLESLVAQPYADRLVGLKAQIAALETAMAETQEAIEAVTAERIQTEVDAAGLANLQAEYRADQRALEQNYEQLRVSAAQAADTVMITEPARVPETPVHTRYWYALLAALIGALVGVGLAFLFDFLDETIRTSTEIDALLSLGTLGTIDRLDKKQEPLVMLHQPLSPAAECFRILATNLRFSSVDKPLRTILITSARPLEGKSLVAANLGAALAQLGLHVAVVDADFRRPRQHTIFGLSQGHGLGDALLAGTARSHLQPTSLAGLSVLTCGEIPYDPALLVGSEQMRRLLEELTETCDIIVVDSPPVLLAADACSLSTTVDGVLLVVRMGKTHGHAAQEAAEGLRRVGANVVGAVLNMVPKRKDSYYDYKYQQRDDRRTTLASVRS